MRVNPARGARNQHRDKPRAERLRGLEHQLRPRQHEQGCEQSNVAAESLRLQDRRALAA